MIEEIAGMPAGTVGFRVSEDLTADDYRSRLEPAMRAAAEAGEIRLLLELGPDFEHFEAGAMLEDFKTGVGLGIGHHSAWKRVAVVTDVGWIQRAMRLFAWMSPGEVRAWALDDLETAKDWVAG